MKANKPLTASKETSLAPKITTATYTIPTLTPNVALTPTIDNQDGPGVATSTTIARIKLKISSLYEQAYFRRLFPINASIKPNGFLI